MTQEVDFKIESIPFYGRTLTEYLKFFDLSLENLKRLKILDCPAGAASFVAEVYKLGIDATACDIAYGEDLEVLYRQGLDGIKEVISVVRTRPELFYWDFYSDVNDLKNYRRKALDIFADDYQQAKEKRYIGAELPNLPFGDQEFDLVLSGHFLFLHDDKLDNDFHVATLSELFRVCRKELRIFPTCGPDGKASQYLDSVVDVFQQYPCQIHLIDVPWKFRKGSEKALIIIRSNEQ